jgi:hypothetical protein
VVVAELILDDGDIGAEGLGALEDVVGALRVAGAVEEQAVGDVGGEELGVLAQERFVVADDLAELELGVAAVEVLAGGLGGGEDGLLALEDALELALGHRSAAPPAA